MNLPPIVIKFFRALKFIVLGLSVLFFIMVGAINLPAVHKILTTNINKILSDRGLPIHAGKITLLVNGNIGLSNVKVATSSGDSIVSAGSITLSVQPLSLISRRMVVREASFEDVDIHLVTDRQTGELNLLALFRNSGGQEEASKVQESGTSSPWELDISQIHLQNIRFLYKDSTAGIFVQQYLKRADLKIDTISLSRQKIDIGYLGLENSRGKLELFGSRKNQAPEEEAGDAWQISLRRLEADDILFDYHQKGVPQQTGIRLRHGLIKRGMLDLAQKQLMVSGIELDQPVLDLTYTNPGERDALTKANEVDKPAGRPWNISLDFLKVNNGLFSYLDQDTLRENFMSGWMPVSNFNTSIRDLKFSPLEYGLTISELSFGMNQKICLNSGEATIRLDSALNGRLTIDLSAVPGEREARLTKSNPLIFSAALSGSPDSVQIEKCRLLTPGGGELALSGFVRDIFKLPESGCLLNLRTSQIRKDQLARLLEVVNPSLKLPDFDPVRIEGVLERSFLQPKFKLTVQSGSGSLSLAGNLDLKQKSGRAETAFLNVELGKLTGVNAIGSVSGSAEWEGRYPNLKEMYGKGFLLIDSVSYKGRKFGNLRLDASAAKEEYRFDLAASDSTLNCKLTTLIAATNGTMKGILNGSFDLEAGSAGLVPFPLKAGGRIFADMHYSEDSIGANLKLKDLLLGNGKNAELLKKTELTVSLTDSQVSSALKSDFFMADFQSSNSMGSLKDYFENLNLEKIFHLSSGKIIDVQQVEQFPGFHLSAMAEYHPVFQLFLPDSVFSFKRVQLNADKKDRLSTAGGLLSSDIITINNIDVYGSKFHFELQPDHFNGHLLLDSLVAGKIKADSTSLTLDLLPGVLRSNILVTKGNKEVVYEIGTELQNRDDKLIMRSSLPEWTLNTTRWSLKSKEFLVIDKGFDELAADLHLANSGMRIDLSGKKSDNLRLDLGNVLISKLLPSGLIHYLPDGKLSALINYKDNGQKKLDYSFDISEVKWEDVPVEKVSGSGDLLADSTGIRKATLAMALNDTSRVNLQYKPLANDPGTLVLAGIDKIPFNLLGPILKNYADRLEGTASGELSVELEKNKPVLNGEVELKQVSLRVKPLNSWFTIPGETVRLKSNKLFFTDFEVLDSLGQHSRVDGEINLEDPRNFTADLRVVLDRLRVMNTGVKDNPVFSGSVVVNSDLTIKGALLSPAIRGNLALENGTDITYRQIEDLNVKETQKNILFAKLDGNRLADVKTMEKVSQFTKMPSIQAAIEINPKSVFNLVVSKGFDIFLQVAGGGMLNYSTLPNGMSSLTGTYEIKSGTTDVKFPGWPNKEFVLTSGSTLRWNGSMEDPELNLEATTRVKGSYINPIDNKSRTVDFIVALKLVDRFSQIRISFEIKSPDQYMASVLNSLSADEQMRQAVNLVLFEAIDLPQMQSSTNYVAAQMAGFWESQLNSFTKTSLKKVDLSFGIDTHTQMTASGGSEEKTNLTYNLERKILQDRASVKLSGRLTDDTHSSSQTNSMIENFSFEYSLDSIGNKYLKLYRNMDYENILEGEIIKSGIGFKYHRNYARIKDIWQRRDTKKKKVGNN